MSECSPSNGRGTTALTSRRRETGRSPKFDILPSRAGLQATEATHDELFGGGIRCTSATAQNAPNLIPGCAEVRFW